MSSRRHRVAVDLHALQTPSSRHRGIGRYVEGLLAALLPQTPPSIEWVFYASDALPAPELDPGNHLLRTLPAKALLEHDRGDIGMRDTFPLEAVYRTQLLADAVDAVLLPSPMEGDDCALPDFGAFPARLYCIAYDLIPLIYADSVFKEPVALERYHRRLRNIRFADGVFAISDATRQDAVKLLHVPEERTHTIFAGVSGFFEPIAPGEQAQWRKALRKKFGIGDRFLMYNGGSDWRKNQEGLIEAFAALPKDVAANLQLVFTCRFSDDMMDKFRALAKSLGISRDRLILTGYCSDDELRAMYSLCLLFVYPSLHEGFGLPIAEAMRCGAPTIVADNSCLPEVVGDPSALFATGSAPAITEKITQVLRDPAVLNGMRSRARTYADRFTWEKVAAHLLEPMVRDLEANAAKPSINMAFRRLRQSETDLPPVAVMAPLSAEGDADTMLLPELAAHFSVLPVLPEDAAPVPRLAAPPVSFAEWEAALLDKKSVGNVAPVPLPCDALLCFLGDHARYADAYAALCRYAPITVLLDYEMNAVLSALHSYRSDLAVSLEAELLHNYPDPATRRQVRDALISGDTLSAETLAAQERFTNRRVFSRSLGVVMQTEALRQKAVAQHGSDCEHIAHIPPAVETPAAPMTQTEVRARRETLELPPAAFVVVAVGAVRSGNHSLALLDAFGKLRQSVPDARLVLVGADGFGGDFPAEVTRRGLADAVRVTGALAAQTARDYIIAADVCAYLSPDNDGRGVAGLLQILSHGKACVVSGSEAFADFGAVCRVLPNAATDAAIFDALTHLTEPSRRETLAQTAWEHVRREHDPARCAARYAAFYAEIMANGRTHRRLFADYAGRDAATHLVQAGRWATGSASPLPRLLSEILRGA